MIDQARSINKETGHYGKLVALLLIEYAYGVLRGTDQLLFHRSADVLASVTA